DEDTVHRKIDDAAAILRNDFARSKTEFYFVGNAGHDGEAGVSIDWLNPAQDGGTGIPLGAILKARGSGAERRGLVSPGPVLPKPGDSVRIHSAEDKERQSHKITAVESDGSTGLWISIPEGVETGDGVYLTQTKAMTKRYPQIATGHHHSRREPGHDKAPVPEVAFGRSKTVSRGKAARDLLFPEGLYVAVSRIEDLYVLQSARPLRVMLALTRRTLAKLLEKGRPPLPFNKGELILTLDPYFPQGDEAYMGEAIETLLDEGYRQFVVNNPGHFSYFRGASNGSDAVGLIAGPYLYTFNRWALSFVSSLGADYVVSPLENNRQNLEKTLDSACRSHAFVTIFAWPALFRIRANLGTKYRFNRFSDSRGEEFLLNSGDEGSIVYPERPFSIVDKVPFLQTAGFSRFILDLSGGKALKKAHYRDLIKSVREVVPLPDISRFNWKDGFFQQES
ncbi:MAG: U32 family peptidase, partial [Treponema sp.]|nr:U32 family peptidase [Treponema sp.]